MQRPVRCWLSVLLAVCVVGCSTTQTHFRPLGPVYPARLANAPVELFESGAPSRPFERIARLDVHFEKTALVSTSHETALKALQAEARAAGADAIIDIDERRSRINETLVLHVTGTGIRYAAP